MENQVHTAVSVAGMISGVFLYLSPMSIILRMVKESSSREFSLTPFNMAFLNCLFTLGYASMSSNWLAFVANMLDLCIILFYMIVVIFLSPTKILLLKRVGALFGVEVALVTYACVSHSMQGRTKALFNGFLATAFSIAIYTKLLILVIKTKEVEFMSFYAPILFFLNGAFWFAYGVLLQDFFIVLSYGFACAVGALQMYLMYPNNKGKGKVKTA